MHSDDPVSASFQAAMRDIAALARRLEVERAEAATLCDEVLAGPRAWWAERLRTSVRGRTTATVQLLAERSALAVERSPEQAQLLTTIALQVADAIDPATYPSLHLELVRGQALRAHAVVLAFRGLCAEALPFVERAEAIFGCTPGAAYEGARVKLVKAAIFRDTGRIDEAVALTREAAATFLRFGDRCRYVDARMSEGGVLYVAGAIDRALEVWRLLEHDPALDATGRVRIAHNLGLCLSDLGDHEAAIPYLSRCIMHFDQLGMTTECTRSRAVLGRSLLAAGKPHDAIPILIRATEEFESLGMILDAGLVALEHVEALFTIDRTAEAAALCRQAIGYFTRAGVAGYASSALAYLREATLLQPAAPMLVREASVSLRKLACPRPRLFAPEVREQRT